LNVEDINAPEATNGVPPAIGSAEDFPSDEFLILVKLVVSPSAGALNPTMTKVRGIEWHNSRFYLRVAEVASTPDDALIDRVAQQLDSVRDLDFTIPPSALADGFQRAGGAPSFPMDVTDYTVSWAPGDSVGATRAEAGSMPDKGPTIFINVGSRFYAQSGRTLSSDPATAEMKTESDIKKLDFVMNGSLVSVGGRQVDDQALRAFATSLNAMTQTAWRAQLGDRLLVDTSAQSNN